MNNLWLHDREIDSAVRLHDSVYDLIEVAQDLRTSFLSSGKALSSDKVLDMQDDNKVVMLLAQLRKQDIIPLGIYNQVFNTSYEHACFSVLVFLDQKWYFKNDLRTYDTVERLSRFYQDNFEVLQNGIHVDSMIDQTREEVWEIVSDEALTKDISWLLWEVEDMIDICDNFFEKPRRKENKEIPDYILDIPQRLRINNIIWPNQYNSLVQRLNICDSLESACIYIVYYLHNNKLLNQDDALFQKASIFLTRISKHIRPKERNTVRKNIYLVINEYGAKKKYKKLVQRRYDTLMSITSLVIDSQENPNMNLSLVYEFFQDLEDQWFISSNQHFHLIKNLEILSMRQTLCIAILEALHCGVYSHDVKLEQQVCLYLQTFFRSHGMRNEAETIEDFITINIGINYNSI